MVSVCDVLPVLSISPWRRRHIVRQGFTGLEAVLAVEPRPSPAQSSVPALGGAARAEAAAALDVNLVVENAYASVYAPQRS
jgi:hypothetical protein